MRIGIDAGGTFTDFIVLDDDGRLRSFKIRSDRAAPARVILEGIARAAGIGNQVGIVHGSTVATNALLERKGAVTALVTTAGFEDLIHIGRQNRSELYNLTPAPPAPLVPRERCVGVEERAHFDGSIERRPDIAALEQVTAAVRKSGVRAVAICFLHSYQNAENERTVAQYLDQAFGGDVYVCRSEEVSPEFREYERASTTVINAYVGPLMDDYLAELERGAPGKIWILQSNGGYIKASEARRHAVRTVLSGPAGGVIGAVELARLSGIKQILAFDMGGTSTDVSLCEGDPKVSMELRVDGFPVHVPMLDIHTVGAGGGSIARVDAGGLLRVGPESAGADPGPACYGSGYSPTVTDAQVVLGRIAPAQFLSGGMPIYPDRAETAVRRIGELLGLDVLAAAAGIIRVANANMERAIRAVSVERGYDPRDFTLVAFGGAGGLHACDLAEQLDLKRVLAPRYSEGLSALGMLLADGIRDYSAAVLGRTDLEQRFRELERQARAELGKRAALSRSADLRYAGQSYELTVPWVNHSEAAARFHDEHRKVYGYSSPSRAIEVVTVRVQGRLATTKPVIAPLAKDPSPPAIRRIYAGGRWRQVPVYRREQLARSTKAGPALVTDYGATTLVNPGWNARVDRVGNLILCRDAGDK